MWRQVPGRSSEASVPAAPTPGLHPPDKPGQGGRSGQPRPDGTGRDAGGATTSEPGCIPGRPARGRVGRRSPPKTGRALPPAGRRELLQVPRKWQQVLPWGASHGPTIPISHTSNTSCLCLGQGNFRRTKPEPCRGPLPSLTHQGSEPHCQHPLEHTSHTLTACNQAAEVAPTFWTLLHQVRLSTWPSPCPLPAGPSGCTHQAEPNTPQAQARTDGEGEEAHAVCPQETGQAWGS